MHVPFSKRLGEKKRRPFSYRRRIGTHTDVFVFRVFAQRVKRLCCASHVFVYDMVCVYVASDAASMHILRTLALNSYDSMNRCIHVCTCERGVKPAFAK